MSALGKKLPKNTLREAANNRYKWVEFVANDSEPDGEGNRDPQFDYLVRCEVRTSLTNAEIQVLADYKGTDQKLWELVYPYVRSWDVVWWDGKDNYEVLPPVEGGAESFNYAPKGLCFAIVNALTMEAFAKVSPKSSKPATTTE